MKRRIKDRLLFQCCRSRLNERLLGLQPETSHVDNCQPLVERPDHHCGDDLVHLSELIPFRLDVSERTFGQRIGGLSPAICEVSG